MKTTMTKVLAILAMAGGLTEASRAAETFTAYGLSIAYTNAEAGYWSVNGAPRTTSTLFVQVTPSSTSVQTDDAGRISGTGLLVVTYNTAGVPFSQFAVNYSGQISGRAGSAPTATVNIHGNGFTVDGTGGPTATLNSISLKFVGAPGVNPLNNTQTRIVGQLTGTIRGKTPLGDNSTPLPSLGAVITGSSSNLVAVNTILAENSNRIVLFDAGFNGSGSVQHNGSYRFNALGTGDSRGAIFMLSGTVGPHTNQIGTNPVTFSAPISAELKGKVKGQVVSGSASSGQISAALVH